MNRQTTIEIFHEDLSFSAGHFIVFTPNERSKLHGHNFHVHASLTTALNDNGLTFDYRDYKQKIRALCQQLNGIFLLAGKSPYLEFREEGQHLQVHFNDEIIPFLTADVLLLPIRNITVEELSYWFLQQLITDHALMHQDLISAMTIKISSAFGVYGSTSWTKENGTL